MLKNRYASAKASNAALVKHTDWIIKNDHVINCAMFFCNWFKHGQASKVIWLSTTWFLIHQQEVANKKPLFTTNPTSIWTEKRYNILLLQNFLYTPTPGCYTGKMLFSNASKITRNWFLTLQPDNYVQFSKAESRKGIDVIWALHAI